MLNLFFVFYIYHSLKERKSIFLYLVRYEFSIRKILNPLTKYVPLIEFMITTRFINIRKYLVVQHYGAALIVRGWKQLDELPPAIFFGIHLSKFRNYFAIFIVIDEFISPVFQLQNQVFQNLYIRFTQMFC